MSGMDWDNDPELQALRREFVQSFAERARALRTALENGIDAKKIEQVAHKLAGAARSYGFAEIGDLAERIEDLAGAGGRNSELPPLVSCLCGLLEDTSVIQRS